MSILACHSGGNRHKHTIGGASYPTCNSWHTDKLLCPTRTHIQSYHQTYWGKLHLSRGKQYTTLLLKVRVDSPSHTFCCQDFIVSTGTLTALVPHLLTRCRYLVRRIVATLFNTWVISEEDLGIEKREAMTAKIPKWTISMIWLMIFVTYLLRSWQAKRGA